MLWLIVLAAVLAVLALWVLYDLVQTQHAVIRNFPIVGHFRYWLESIGPELRQYIVTDNDEERPFSRDQRRWVYASAKEENNAFGFGSDNEMEMTGPYVLLKHAAFPLQPPAGVAATEQGAGRDPLPGAKVLGAARGRALAFRPPSAVNISGMSFGSLSGRAVEAMNLGARGAGCLHNTGEGGLAPHHQLGGDLVLQLGPAYFGCRDERGRFSLDRLQAVVAENPVRAIELKLSQGAKPGVGALLPAAKVTPEIARIRGIPAGVDCVSPASHTEFSDVDSMLDFVEHIATATGLPVGIKSAVGEQEFWDDLARLMESGERGVDFITVDGGEGGTGAGPLVFTDHVALPFKMGFARVYRSFAARGIDTRVAFVGSGKLGLPENAIVAFALGCDMVNVGREAMLAVGVHPGTALPHRRLPHRRRDAVALACAGPRPAEQVAARRQLRACAAPRAACAGVRRRGCPPCAHRARPARDHGRAAGRDDAAGAFLLRGRLGAAGCRRRRVPERASGGRRYRPRAQRLSVRPARSRRRRTTARLPLWLRLPPIVAGRVARGAS